MKNLIIFFGLLSFSCSSKSDTTDLVDGLGGLEMVDGDSSVTSNNEANLIDLALNEPVAENSISFPDDAQSLDLANLDSNAMGSGDMVDLGSGPDIPLVDSEEVTLSEGSTIVDTSSTQVPSEQPQLSETMTTNNSSPVSEENLEFQNYKVKKGDTLMLIAFKLFGDYTKWQDLQDWNNLGSAQLATGMNLKYKMYLPKYEWNPQGTPYLIQWGDTLGKIAANLYGDLGRWKDLWNNNKPLVRDPNKIFAGFTLYYLP